MLSFVAVRLLISTTRMRNSHVPSTIQLGREQGLVNLTLALRGNVHGVVQFITEVHLETIEPPEPETQRARSSQRKGE